MGAGKTTFIKAICEELGVTDDPYLLNVAISRAKKKLCLVVSGNEQPADSNIKDLPMDFAVWKAKKEGEPSWMSPWGEGRPGWHIECSAMANKYLGETIDIHSGGQDLIFPHHENEIAQSEAANGVPFANYWLHNGYINVNNQKMSKSLGNFFTVRDVASEFDYSVIRFFMLSAHYRNPINFSHELLTQAKAGLDRIKNCVKNIEFLLENAEDGTLDSKFKEELEAEKERFCTAMDDDINTADAISVIFDMVRAVNVYVKDSTCKQDLNEALSYITELCDVLGIEVREEKELPDSRVEELINERTQAKKDKNFARADEIRDMLKEMGIILEDTRQGVKWKRV